MQVESTDVPIQNVELMSSNSIQTAYTPAPMAAQCPEDRPSQPSQPQWPKPTYMPADANVRSTNAHIAAQYTEETMHDDASIRSGCIDVSAVHTAARHANETMASHQITLRRSNVDGDFYPQEFGHEEVVRTMDEDRSQTSSSDELWKKEALGAFSGRVHPETQYGSSLGREIRGIAERPRRSLQNVRAQELAEPFQSPNGSLRECTLPSVRVQELAEPPQRPNSLEFWQAQPLDELRRLAVELKRRLELGIAGLMALGSGPTNGFYPAQTTEQGIPSVVRPDPYPKAHRSGPTDERFFQRFIDEGTPSVVRPTPEQAQHPDVRLQTPPSNAYGHAHSSYPDGSPARVLSDSFPTQRRMPEKRTTESVTGQMGQPPNRVLLDSFPSQRRMPEKRTFECVSEKPSNRVLSNLSPSPRQMS